jgi:hypothetical protein
LVAYRQLRLVRNDIFSDLKNKVLWYYEKQNELQEFL